MKSINKYNNKYIVNEDLSINTIYGILNIKKGFESDLYTNVPDLKWEIPAIVHDYLYSKGNNIIYGKVLTRKECDIVFYYLILKSPYKIDRYFAKLYYYGVRMLAKNKFENN